MSERAVILLLKVGGEGEVGEREKKHCKLDASKNEKHRRQSWIELSKLTQSTLFSNAFLKCVQPVMCDRDCFTYFPFGGIYFLTRPQ